MILIAILKCTLGEMYSWCQHLCKFMKHNTYQCNILRLGYGCTGLLQSLFELQPLVFTTLCSETMSCNINTFIYILYLSPSKKTEPDAKTPGK